MRVLKALLLWLALTLVQGVVLIALALTAYAAASGLTGNGDLVLGAALAVPILSVVAAEIVLPKTPVAWLRLSQNPVFLLPP